MSNDSLTQFLNSFEFWVYLETMQDLPTTRNCLTDSLYVTGKGRKLFFSQEDQKAELKILILL